METVFIPAPLQDMEWDIVEAQWKFVPDDTNTLWGGGFFIEKIDVALKGAFQDSATEPYRTMNSWYSKNKTVIDGNGVGPAGQVSSWAIIVNIITIPNTNSGTAPKGMLGWGLLNPPSIVSTFTTAASGWTPNACAIDAVSTTYNACLPVNFDQMTANQDLGPVTGTAMTHVIGDGVRLWASGADQQITGCTSQKSALTVDFDTVAPVSGFTVSAPAVGEIGDAIGVYISNQQNKSYKPYALRAAMVTTKVANIDFNGANTIVQAGAAAFQWSSWAATYPKLEDSTDIFKAGVDYASEPVWQTMASCDIKKWQTQTACFGVLQPWIIGKGYTPNPSTKGQLQAYHWLADANPSDPSKVFVIEKDHVLEMLVWESVVPRPNTPNLSYLKTAQTNLSGNGGYDLRCAFTSRQNNWGISTYSVSGAASLLGVSAVIASFASAFF